MASVQWEYLFVDVEKDKETMPNFDRMGENGWELVSHRETESTGSRSSYQEWVRFYFKRVKPRVKQESSKKD